jgi:hypothetical protein
MTYPGNHPKHLPPKMKTYAEIYKDAAITRSEPLPMRDYRFKTYPGLPPNGEPGLYIGFDQDHRPWILSWMPEVAGGCWAALGFSFNKNHQCDLPEHRLCTDNYRDFVKEWAHSPVCEPIAPKLQEEELADAYRATQDWSRPSKHYLQALKKGGWL